MRFRHCSGYEGVSSPCDAAFEGTGMVVTSRPIHQYQPLPRLVGCGHGVLTKALADDANDRDPSSLARLQLPRSPATSPNTALFAPEPRFPDGPVLQDHQLPLDRKVDPSQPAQPNQLGRAGVTATSPLLPLLRHQPRSSVFRSSSNRQRPAA